MRSTSIKNSHDSSHGRLRSRDPRSVTWRVTPGGDLRSDAWRATRSKHSRATLTELNVERRCSLFLSSLVSTRGWRPHDLPRLRGTSLRHVVLFRGYNQEKEWLSCFKIKYIVRYITKMQRATYLLSNVALTLRLSYAANHSSAFRLS